METSALHQHLPAHLLPGPDLVPLLRHDHVHLLPSLHLLVLAGQVRCLPEGGGLALVGGRSPGLHILLSVVCTGTDQSGPLEPALL